MAIGGHIVNLMLSPVWPQTFHAVRAVRGHIRARPVLMQCSTPLFPPLIRGEVEKARRDRLCGNALSPRTT
jgi:hypothetical protein